MRTLKLTAPVDIESIKHKMKTAKNTTDYKRWQVIYLLSSYQLCAADLSNMTGYSKANIYAVVRQFNHSVSQDVSTEKRGGRRRSFLTLEQEKKLMKGLEQKALAGQILSYLDIKKIVEKEVGKAVSQDFIWDLFKRNGWTKHSPRPYHPKKNSDLQEDFKKNSKSVWIPLTMNLRTI